MIRCGNCGRAWSRSHLAPNVCDCGNQVTAGPKPHKHAAVIKAWADGAEIEWRCPGSVNGWAPVGPQPQWQNCYEYRVKPAGPDYATVASKAYYDAISDPNVLGRQTPWAVAAAAVIAAYKKENKL